jgi:hypothetical protein
VTFSRLEKWSQREIYDIASSCAAFPAPPGRREYHKTRIFSRSVLIHIKASGERRLYVVIGCAQKRANGMGRQNDSRAKKDRISKNFAFSQEIYPVYTKQQDFWSL